MSRAKIQLLNVSIDNLTMAEALDRARGFLKTKKFHHIVTPGPEFLLEATAHPRFRKILQDADLSLPDGMGLHLGSRLTKQRLVERVPGADFVDGLLTIAEREGKSVFLFGGAPGTVDRAGETIAHRHPQLKIVGLESGYRGAWQKLHDRRVLEKIHLAKPDILLVALGFPKQELWIDQHRQALHDVGIAIGVGRTLEYLAGTIKRAPKFMRATGFEWLHTYLYASRYYHGKLRRQRVGNATLRFLMTVIRPPHA